MKRPATSDPDDNSRPSKSSRRNHGPDVGAQRPLQDESDNPPTDHLSKLSNELLLRILSFVPVPSLIAFREVSRKCESIANDSQLWKAAYYNRFVRPRAAQIPGASPAHLFYSSKSSKWLDEAHLVQDRATDWARQYRLRHNWGRGTCAVSEIPLIDRPSEPSLIVQMHGGLIFTADSRSGLRVWSLKAKGALVASTTLISLETGICLSPSALDVNRCDLVNNDLSIAVGFQDGSFRVYALNMDASSTFTPLHTHDSTSNGKICALAYSSPYVLHMDSNNLLSLYILPSSNTSEPSSARLLYSLGSSSVEPPVSLSLKQTPTDVTAAVAFVRPCLLSGWSVVIQEMRHKPSGVLVDARLAEATEEHFQSHSRYQPRLITTIRSPQSSAFGGTNYTKPTALSYNHPHLVAAHPDNTLTLYLVKSTSQSLSISPGTRLWGHTSSVSGVQVNDRGKAVSVSRQGNEMRVWEVEGGLSSLITRKRWLSGELSIQVRPEKNLPGMDLGAIPKALLQEGCGLGFALEHRFDDLTATRGLVGFDEENIVVLQQKSQGGQSLLVYNFT